jgi:hypothetical protein
MTPAPFDQTIRRDHEREICKVGDSMSVHGVRRTEYLFLNSLFSFVYRPGLLTDLNSISLQLKGIYFQLMVLGW